MAGFAAALERGVVRIFTAVTATAIFGQLLRCHGSRVTGVAIYFGVRAKQRKVMFSRMVVVGDLPMIVVVTVAALRPKTGCMRIVGLVAAIAVLRDLLLVITAAVTRHAVDPIVDAQQFIAGFLEVVELGRLPLLGHMALRTILAARTTMLIVGGVTCDASLGRLPVLPADVAGIACDRRVSPGQFEVRLVMIELASGPTHRAMAVAACLAELAVVHVVRLVAARAARDGFAPGFGLLVTALAAQLGMCSLKSKVGEAVIEQRTIQTNDICRAALVFGMARAALADAGIGHASVITLMLLQVHGDGLVTVQAQRGLRPDVGAVVAVRATFFLLQMRLCDLSRHEKSFDIGGQHRPR